MSDFDSPWKEVLDHFFQLAVAFLLPTAHQEIDWSADQEPLETEMRKLLAQAEVGPRRFDKLVKVVRKGSGDPALMHLEAQMQPEEGFSGRMYVYNYKAHDRYNYPVVSLAILGDDSPSWRPGPYLFQLWGCQVNFTFVSVKLLDWRGREEELERHDNPFAVFVLAHLMTLATRDEPDARAAWKLRLAKNFLARPMANEDRRQWFRLIDWLLELPPERNVQIWNEIYELEDTAVPFLAYFEREEQRIAAEAEQRGLQIGEQRGLLSGLLRGMRGLLLAKFGPASQPLVSRLEQVTDLELANRLFTAAEGDAGLDELGKMLG